MPSNKEQFNLNIFDYSSVAYCVIELVLNENNKPVDWIYRYCNQAFADIKGYRLEKMIDRSFLSLYPSHNEKLLNAFYKASYENIPCEINVSDDEKYNIVIMPIGKKGFCSEMIYKSTETKTQNDDIENEEYIIKSMFTEFVSLYSIELNSGNYEVLRIAENTNAKKIVDAESDRTLGFDDFCRQYADCFISEEEREEFLNWHCCRNMKKRLGKKDKITYHYHSVSEDGKHNYYEAYAVKGKVDYKNFRIFLGYRNIDSILYKEKAIQEKLQKALDETKLSNEIISSIAKTYQYISRIDIKSDWYEDITNNKKRKLVHESCGILSVNSEKICKKYIAEEYQEAFINFIDTSTLSERMGNEETIAMEYRMKDGSWNKLRFIEKKRDESNNLTNVICVVRSISDEKMLEQKLLYQVAEAKRETAVKSRFLSTISHDIKTPMNGIIGMVELANRYPYDNEIQKKCKDKIMESSKFLISLINNILDINKLESGDIVDQNITFDLTELLKKANHSKQIMAENKNVDYIVDWNKSDLKHIYLIGNPFYLKRMLTAVSDNAVKFTNSGGCVRVWCIEKSQDDEQAIYEFGCSDNGIGMSESFLEQAFDIFSQEKQTSRSKYEGTGLGLAIAKKLAEKMGGNIEIKSKKGVGTTVIMTIPFKIGKEEKIPKNNNRKKEVSIKGMRALIAEDNELNMEIVKCILEDNGVFAECACDGLEAVKKFESSSPGYYDVIFMDIMMPNMNGWDATRKIRSMNRIDSETIPIIAMSANAFTEDIINSRISGMNEHISKPFSEQKFINIIKEYMENC